MQFKLQALQQTAVPNPIMHLLHYKQEENSMETWCHIMSHILCMIVGSVTCGLEGLTEHKTTKIPFIQANIAYTLFSHSELCVFDCCVNVSI